MEIVEFTLGGGQFQAMEAGPLDQFNHVVSFLINCDDQAEADRLSEALGEGGSYEACGWLRDDTACPGKSPHRTAGDHEG